MSDADVVMVGEWLTRLAIARGSALDDVTCQVYLDALADMDAQLISRACLALSVEPREPYETALPSVATIRQRAQEIRDEDIAQAQRDRLLPMPALMVDDDPNAPKYFCLACKDEPFNWKLVWCRGTGTGRVAVEARPDRASGMPVEQCGRRQDHHAHVFAVKCECADTNPVTAEIRRRIAQYRAAKQSKRKGAA